MIHRNRLTLLPVLALFTGCASYTVPGPAADMQTFGIAPPELREQQTDFAIREHLDKEPLASFPARLAIARVQDSGYRSYRLGSYGRGAYSVVTTRDAETQEHLERLANLPLVAGVGPINRLLLPQTLDSDKELREAAAMLHADILRIYTLDTDFHIGDNGSPIDVVTLGFLPHKEAHVVTTASAALLDTRNGYVYGVAEGTGRHSQPANTWTSEAATDEARQKAEAAAMAELAGALEQTWRGVVKQYAAAAEPR